MTKATKLSSGNYRCKAYYTDENGKYTSKSFTAETKKEAEYAAASFLVDMKHKKKPENKTIGELTDIYLDNRSNVLSPSTMRGYRTIRRTAFEELMKTRAGFVTQQMYQAAVNEYTKGKAPKTVMEAHRLVCRVFQENHVEINDKAIILPQMIRTKIKIPTTEEVKLILQEASKKEIYLPVLFAVLLGLRKSEIFGLTWADIDMKNNLVLINKVVVKNENEVYVEKRTTKTMSSTRSLYMPPQIAEALTQREEDNKRLFDINPEAFSSRYKRITAKLGLKYSFHALRHPYVKPTLKFF